jgi:Transglutaminase-like superfamily
MTADPPMSRPEMLVAAMRGAWMLALARGALQRIGPAGVQQRNVAAAHSTLAHLEESANDQCDRVAFIIPRIARRVPWRADCLVQALAGQCWLQQEGVPSEIVVGTARKADGTFEAHAWLRRGNRVILGGDISRFQPLLTPDSPIFPQG